MLITELPRDLACLLKNDLVLYRKFQLILYEGRMHCVFAKCIPATFLHDLVLSRKHLAHSRGILGPMNPISNLLSE
jgi:hypothetical protein